MAHLWCRALPALSPRLLALVLLLMASWTPRLRAAEMEAEEESEMMSGTALLAERSAIATMRTIDQDEDGYASLTELEDFVGSEDANPRITSQVRRHFADSDVDGDKRLSTRELLDFVSRLESLGGDES
eukprot:TRINITY_DN24517_c0_g2_i1.p1 TRINITY_DN24517_c0_g2~~TRINITY_DN24517_c0_g2_i1.p1  ORF type:complete len:129 (+),score=35.14 TRINITY_DN24517_c0_g2_i1:141-527(+)